MPNVLAVHPDVPAKTVAELIAHAKANPEKLTFSSSGIGNPQQLNGELFNKMAGVRIIHVPYKGAAPQLADLAGNWYSDEARATIGFVVEGDKAFIVNHPVFKFSLRPLYKDAFSSEGGVIWVSRDASGKVDKLHITASRLRDMPFVRVK